VQRVHKENYGAYEVVRVLVCGPNDGHTFFFIYEALKGMGVDAKMLDSRYDYEILFNETKSFNPDFLLLPRQGQLYEGVKKIKEETESKVYVWNTDSRGSFQGYAGEFGENLVNLFRISDCTYNVAIGEVEMFEKEGMSSKWLVQGIGSENKPSIKREYKHEVSFLGSIDQLHEQKGGRVSLLRAIYGAGYDVNLEPAHGNEACRVYYQSRVNLGHAHSPDLGENSVRDFKIMGSGGFLLTQWFRGIEEIHNIGVEMDCYKSIDECVDKVKYYLENEEKREKIAQTGYEACHDRHKYSDRLKTIIEDYKQWT